jgi:hypothetical protein
MMTGLFSGLGGLAKGVSSMGGFGSNGGSAGGSSSFNDILGSSTQATEMAASSAIVPGSAADLTDPYRSRRRNRGLGLLDILY